MRGDDASASHAARTQRLRDAIAAADSGVRLDKDTSNLFRDRTAPPQRRLDVRDFCHVLAVDPAAGTVDVEGMTRYDTLVDACLEHGVMPAVVPELRSITIGGAVSGVGIESSSYRFGLVHATMQEMTVVTGDGTIVSARPDNEHSDLFHGLANSYATLGYALRLRARVIPVKPYVRLTHERYRDADAFFRDLQGHCARGAADFIEGVAFAPDDLVLTRADFVDAAPYTSDYGYAIYYRSLRRRGEDYLTVRDYIWRWDTDWFWCSKNVYAQNPLIRRLFGRRRLNSVTYQRIMRWNARWGITARLERLQRLHSESVIQDVDIPVAHAPDFLRFLDREIGIRPLWVCPVREPPREHPFDLFPLDPDTLYINFGFWDVVRTREDHPEGHFNRIVERKVAELDGRKSLYSSSFYTEDEFWQEFDQSAYRRLKQRYDPEQRLGELYRKTVLGA